MTTTELKAVHFEMGFTSEEYVRGGYKRTCIELILALV